MKILSINVKTVEDMDEDDLRLLAESCLSLRDQIKEEKDMVLESLLAPIETSEAAYEYLRNRTKLTVMGVLG